MGFFFVDANGSTVSRKNRDESESRDRNIGCIKKTETYLKISVSINSSRNGHTNHHCVNDHTLLGNRNLLRKNHRLPI